MWPKSLQRVDNIKLICLVNVFWAHIIQLLYSVLKAIFPKRLPMFLANQTISTKSNFLTVRAVNITGFSFPRHLRYPHFANISAHSIPYERVSIHNLSQPSYDMHSSHCVWNNSTCSILYFVLEVRGKGKPN